MRAASKLLAFGFACVSLLAAADADAATIRARTGATAQVGAAYAGQFQSYIDELEARGAVIRFMGGYRRGHCSERHQHSCGRALDVCQTRRGVVDPGCHLPHRRELAAIAARHGLFEGGRWCNSDYGHAQVGASADCGMSWALVARSHLHHHHRRFAHARRHHRFAQRHRRHHRG